MKRNFSLRKLFTYQEVPALLIGVAAFIFFACTTDKFLTSQNFTLLFNQMSVYGMLGTSLTIVIIIGGMDISVGATLSLCCSVEAVCWMAGKNTENEILWLIFGALMSVAVGTLIGIVLGTMITIFNIPDMVSSLALQNVTRGIAIAITKGQTLASFPRSVFKLGNTKILGMGLPFWVCIIFTIVFTVMLLHTRFGRRIYMLGNNRIASSLAGINVSRTRLLVYTLEGFSVGLTSVVYLAYTCQLNAANCGASILGYVLASALMGGASMDGGRGTAVGTFFGAFALGTIMNGVIHFGVNADAVDIILALLIMVVLVTQYVRVVYARKEASR